MGPGGTQLRTAGLGLWSNKHHATCAYLASCASAQSKCAEIDPLFSWDIDTPGSDAARAFASLHADLPADAALTTQDSRLSFQRTLSQLLDDAAFAAQWATADTAEPQF